MPNIRCVLFDLDGTLITSYMDNEDKDYHRWAVYPGVAVAIKNLKANRIKVGIITNQAGVAFGYNTEADWIEKCGRATAAVGIDKVWSCLHHPKADPPWNDPRQCLRRKPNAAMLEEAMEYFGVASDETLFVGDMDSDEEAARHAHVAYADANAFFQRDPNMIPPGEEWAIYAHRTN